MNRRVDGWIDGWMDGWIDGQMDGLISLNGSMDELMGG